MLEDEPIYTGLECPQCHAHLETPPSAHGEIMCPHCRAIVMFATSEDGASALVARHRIAVPDEMLEPHESAPSEPRDGSAAPGSFEEDAHEFRLREAEAPQAPSWLPPPLPPDAEQEADAELEAVPAVRESLLKTFRWDIFAFPWQRTAIKQWMLLAILTSLTLGLGLLLWREFTAQASVLLVASILFLFPALGLLVYSLVYGSAYLADIIQRTVFHTDNTSEWPEGDWRQRFADGSRILVLEIQAAMVGGFSGGFVSLFAERAFWPVCLVCMFLSFPVILLSALESDSVVAPASPPTLRSLWSCRGAWSVFYLMAAGIWLAWGAVLILIPRVDLVWPLAAGMSFGWAVLAYGRLLGRLAEYLSRHAKFLVRDEEIH